MPKPRMCGVSPHLQLHAEATRGQKASPWELREDMRHTDVKQTHQYTVAAKMLNSSRWTDCRYPLPAGPPSPPFIMEILRSTGEQTGGEHHLLDPSTSATVRVEARGLFSLGMKEPPDFQGVFMRFTAVSGRSCKSGRQDLNLRPLDPQAQDFS